MSDDIAIKVESVSKTFKLPHEKHTSIKGLFVSMFRGKRTYEKQHVLKDISFEIKKGEFFGIVGRNGSGKSTLLKLLAGIYSPDKGHIKVNGKLTPFIELGVGFNPELTGRENVFLNGALLGFNRKQMEAMYDEIVEFAELDKFMDQKLKNYSSGMQVRLAFSIAIRAQGDILILDEVLAVGDEAFQRKCYDYFAQLKIAKKTVILVTHSMDNVVRFCDMAMLVSDGKIEYLGSTNEAVKLYTEKNLNTSLPNSSSPGVIKNDKSEISVEVDVIDKTATKANRFLESEKVRLRVKLVSKKSLKDIFMGLSIHKPSGEALFVKTTEKEGETLPSIKPNVPVYVTYDIQNIFAEDTYYVNVSVKSNNRMKTYITAEDMARFQVVVTGLHRSTLRPEYEVHIDTSTAVHDG